MKCPPRFTFICFYTLYCFNTNTYKTPNRLAILYTGSQTLRKYEIFLCLKVGYTSLHYVSMVIREENVYSYNNAKIIMQKCLFKVVFLIVCIKTKEINTFSQV